MKTEALKKLLESMTLAEKIGQLVQWNYAALAMTDAEVTGPETLQLSADAMKYFGSVLNFSSADEMIRLQKQYMAGQEHPVPLLFMMDVIHGYRTAFPIPLAQAGSFDPDLVKECARAASAEAAAGGVHLTFTPMVDHVRDPRWGRVMESCGEDPYLSGIMGAAQVEGFRGKDLTDKGTLAVCVKHYAGYGAPEGGRDYNQAELSEHVLREWYLPAYKACLDAGADMIMPSFNSLNGLPSVANPWLMNQVLRDEWRFEGAVISDYNALDELITQGVAENRQHAAVQAMNCGCDIDMVSGCYASDLEKAVREGLISEDQINTAAMRVLKVKNDLGLFEDPFRGASADPETVNRLAREHRPLAEKAAIASAVLLKNTGVLPFDKAAKRIAVIGPFADSREIVGAWCCNCDTRETVTVAEGIRTLLPDAEVTVVTGCSARIGDTDGSMIGEAAHAAENADCVILCVGEEMECSGEGRSRASISLPGMQAELVRRVAGANPNTAVVLFGGRPLDLTPVEKIAPAMLEMWMPGTEGGTAAAKLLFGDAEPCGKLAMSFPKSAGQLPLFYARSNTGRPKQAPEDEYQPYCSNYMDCGNLPLYSFGHGLTYTEFRYDELRSEKTELRAGEDLNVTVRLTNTGKRTGTETVQLYINDKFSSVVTPVQKLAAFGRITLAPGESSEISLTVSHERMKLWNFAGQSVIEPGAFEISAGYADHLLLTQTFTVS